MSAGAHMGYIRKRYGVPAKRGGRIRFSGFSDGRPYEGVILSARDGYIFVELEINPLVRKRAKLHPTWRVEYVSG